LQLLLRRGDCYHRACWRRRLLWRSDVLKWFELESRMQWGRGAVHRTEWRCRLSKGSRGSNGVWGGVGVEEVLRESERGHLGRGRTE
jgi:hypothetical protein